MSKETELITRMLNFYADSDKEFSIFQCENWLKEYAKEYHEAEIIKAVEQTTPMYLRGIEPNSFIEVPGMMYDSAEQELTGKHPDTCNLMEVEMRIDRTQIEGYYETCPTSEFSEERKIWTKVVMRSGSEFLLNMPFVDFEKLLHPTIETTS